MCLYVFLFFFSPSSFSGDSFFSIDRFIEPETCGDCHSEIYSQWKTSMHGLAHHDPVYNAVASSFLKGLTDKEEISEAESCVKCHTPVGNVSGYPLKTSDDMGRVAPIATKGIQCDYCHSAVKAVKMFNNGIYLDPGHGEDNPGVKRGPSKDSESDFHESAFSEFHTKSDICGTCHDVSHVSFGTKLETTYSEWKKSPYNSEDPEKRIDCQGCHMFQRPGVAGTATTKRPKNKGKAADDGPDREHVFTHYFAGGNSVIPGLYGDSIKQRLATERLQNSAELSMDTRELGKGVLGITIKNSGAGHYLPTGLTDVRQMWLEVHITDEKGRELFKSGVPDKDGKIPEGSMIYNTVFGDGKGRPVKNIAKAREVLKDNRIPPLQSVSEKVLFKYDKAKTLNVKINLQYRLAPQEVVDETAGKGKIILPVITMEKLEKTVKL